MDSSAQNDDPNDLHLYTDTCKDEADKWLSQFKPGYAWLEPLMSIKEMDILLSIVEAAKGLAHGEDWNKGTHAKIYRPKLIAALRALGNSMRTVIREAQSPNLGAASPATEGSGQTRTADGNENDAQPTFDLTTQYFP
jgi:hypothetical protein